MLHVAARGGLRIDNKDKGNPLVDVFNISPIVRDIGVHLKVDEEQMADHTRK